MFLDLWELVTPTNRYAGAVTLVLHRPNIKISTATIHAVLANHVQVELRLPISVVYHKHNLVDRRHTIYANARLRPAVCTYQVLPYLSHCPNMQISVWYARTWIADAIANLKAQEVQHTLAQCFVGDHKLVRSPSWIM